MKNKKENNFRVINLNWNKLLIGIYALLSINTLFSQQIEKQPYRLGIGVGTHVSGNAHGGVYDVFGSIYNGNSVFSFGPCIQKRSNSICGARLSFSHVLTGRDDFSNTTIKFKEVDKLQLYCFSYLQYLYQTPLSYGAIKREEMASKSNDNPEVDFNKFEFSTTEVGLGFGLNIKLCKKLVWSNFLGFSTFYHTNYLEGMYAERSAPVLMMGSSIGFKFF